MDKTDLCPGLNVIHSMIQVSFPVHNKTLITSLSRKRNIRWMMATEIFGQWASVEFSLSLTYCFIVPRDFLNALRHI